MKTISGKLVFVQPILLPKAGRYISDFASFENNGASEVLSIYLNRASEAFGTLVQLHKDLKHPQSSHKKHRKKKISGNVETMNYDDGEKKSRSHDEKRAEMEDVSGVTKEDASVWDGEDIGESKKKRKEKIHKKGSVEVDDCITSELRKGGENGGSVEVDNRVMDHTKKKKKKKKKGDEVEIKEMGMEGNLEIGQQTKSKKKRKSVDLDGELKDNSIESTRKKRKE